MIAAAILAASALIHTASAGTPNVSCPDLAGDYWFYAQAGVSCEIRNSLRGRTQAGPELIFPTDGFLRYDHDDSIFTQVLRIEQKDCDYKFSTFYKVDGGYSEPQTSHLSVASDQSWHVVARDTRVKMVSSEKSLRIQELDTESSYDCWGLFCGGSLGSQMKWLLARGADGTLRVRFLYRHADIIYVVPVIERYEMDCVFPVRHE